MAQFGIGQPVPRTEDPKFLKGQGRYVDDISLTNQAHGYVLRSPHAHARIKSIDTGAAKAAPGVLDVVTAAELDADGVGPIPCVVMPVAFGGPPAQQVAHPILAHDRVRHVGDPVAFVVADTLEQAKDAAELIAVDYEILPAVTATADAGKPGAPQLWDHIENNVWFDMERGDREATDAAFEKAAHVCRLTAVNNRLSPNTMEPRCSLAEYSSAGDRYTLYTSSQGPHQLRPGLAGAVFHKPNNNFRVVCPDVGGGFGMKGNIFPEDALVLWTAQRVGRPVGWTGDRSESLLSDTHGRDAVAEAELALDSDGRILGLRVKSVHAMGAYLSYHAPVPPVFGSTVFVGIYQVPAVHATIRAVFTNTPWTGPYRGAGRPEAIYVIERLIDQAARELNIDPAEIRRRNMVPADAMPYQTKLMMVYDSGDFEAAMDKSIDLADWQGFEARRAESDRAGKLRGIGLTYFIEPGAPFNERMEVHFDEGANVTIVAGTHSHGQGHATAYAQMVHEWLGVPFDSIRLVQGDTDTVSFGRGTYGSRSMTIGGSALKDAADRIVEKARSMAAHVLEAAEADIEFADGTFTVAGTDKKIELVDVAKASYAPVGWPAEFGVGLEAAGSFAPTAPNFPNGCHICEVEVDRDTGHVELVRYSAVDDSGVIINPMLLEGQLHGGLAQGVGQALLENMAFDPESGQVLSGSFMDYCMPRADDLPYFTLGDSDAHCTTNPLGVKGAGESGTVAAVPAVIHAILDALKPYGVTDMALPATPERVWQAMRQGKAA